MPGGPHNVLVFAGPTASGKSALALEAARENDGVVTNADSLQVYDALPLLTARPSAGEQEGIPHRLYAALSPDLRCSAALWRDLALTEIDAALEAGRTPVLAGGTGLYLKALIEGLSPLPAVAPEIREAANALQAGLGNPGFHGALAARDPVMAARLNPNDTQRLIRAWEVFEATGQSLSEWQSLPPEGAPAHLRFHIFILMPEREALYERCNRRFDSMMQAGALEEVRALDALIATNAVPKDAHITQALGFRALQAHLRGSMSLEDAIIRAKTDTRQYAKRQATWFRHQIRPHPAIFRIETLVPY